ncbi:MAG: type II toxin-antitoxin system VapC family toxin [Microscillaceae bacterium]|nr:type II toxin-antitoxin system VapC family toxin [Microscillaceae bacterium]
MNYLLDTNIILIYGRDSEISDKIEKEYNLFSEENNLAISVVTLGELNSLTRQFKFGEKRRGMLYKLVEDIFKIDINFEEIIEKYGEIDAFSQGKLENQNLNKSSRNMGKNDLWIAATASAYDLILVTTDKDFDHLESEYIQLKYIDLNEYKK